MGASVTIGYTSRETRRTTVRTVDTEQGPRVVRARQGRSTARRESIAASQGYRR